MLSNTNAKQCYHQAMLMLSNYLIDKKKNKEGNIGCLLGLARRTRPVAKNEICFKSEKSKWGFIQSYNYLAGVKFFKLCIKEIV